MSRWDGRGQRNGKRKLATANNNSQTISSCSLSLSFSLSHTLFVSLQNTHITANFIRFFDSSFFFFLPLSLARVHFLVN